jgi:pyridoxal phosphate-dependent aminotransferase EpsN
LKKRRSRGCLPKAIIVVNLYGQSADMEKILDLSERFDVPVVEDAAESLGATYKGNASGRLWQVSVFYHSTATRL